ncbi:uncharacterized protein LOC112568409 [Pomacea canaliculata]|uniref:uncharacterized protein LOC112568409 n=1 Tax=Pomacea canaliculata TaxID=400727 RepID=UPI000D73F510|nr:uncharacterized protein LOC112568409 [Pomacea canaliculata]
MSGSCGLVPVILVLIVAVTGTQAQCTDPELNTLFKCITPYNDKFNKTFGTGGSCNNTIIRVSADVCKDFASIVNCTNQLDVSRTSCRPHAVEQIDQHLFIPCKVNDFKQSCPNAPAIDVGGASGVNISLWLLGVVIIVSLITHM